MVTMQDYITVLSMATTLTAMIHTATIMDEKW
jgi:hypothetical protein